MKQTLVTLPLWVPLWIAYFAYGIPWWFGFVALPFFSVGCWLVEMGTEKHWWASGGAAE